MEVPKASGIPGGMARVGVPLIAGVAGLTVGDVFGAESIVTEFFPATTEGILPFSSRLNYTAFVTAIPYGVALAVVSVASGLIPGDGAWWHVAIFRSARWFLVGIIIHLVLAGILPGRVQPGISLTLPAQVR